MESKLVLGLTLRFLLLGGFPSFTKGQGLGSPSNFLGVSEDIGEKVGGVAKDVGEKVDETGVVDDIGETAGGVAQDVGEKVDETGVVDDIGETVGGVAQDAKKNLGILAAGGAQLAGQELEKALQDGAKENPEYATCFKEVAACKDKPSGEGLCTVLLMGRTSDISFEKRGADSRVSSTADYQAGDVSGSGFYTARGLGCGVGIHLASPIPWSPNSYLFIFI